MKKIIINSVQQNKSPKYVKTSLVKATREDGRKIDWETVNFPDSVHILIDNIDTKEILLVIQPRIPVIVNNPATNGECIEMCAGLIDKNKSIKQIAKEEILEEVGYNVPLKNIITIRNYLDGVNTQGRNIYTFRVQITEDQKISDGRGLDDEDIEILRIPYNKVSDFIFGGNQFKDSFTDATTLYLASVWMLTNKN